MLPPAELMDLEHEGQNEFTLLKDKMYLLCSIHDVEFCKIFTEQEIDH